MTPSELAGEVVATCLSRGLTLATGESLTAGLVASTIAEVPGCSAVLRGAIVAYHVDLKKDLLGVSEEDLSDGIVSRAVATAMAKGARTALRADLGVGTTGVAGPDPHDGQPAGSAWIAVSGASGDRAEHLMVPGDRAEVRARTAEACLRLILAQIRE